MHEYLKFIIIGAAVLIAAAGLLYRKIKRDLKVKGLAYAIKNGTVRVEMSDMTTPKGQTLKKGEVVALVADETQLVFHAYSCPTTGKVERVKFWIDDTLFEEEMQTTRPDAQDYLGLTLALNQFLYENGEKAILPKVRS